jgi:hypothetical protein
MTGSLQIAMGAAMDTQTSERGRAVNQGGTIPIFVRDDEVEAHDIQEAIGIEEIRTAFDKLPPTQREHISRQARRLVSYFKDNTMTVFNFDDALELLAKLGMFMFRSPEPTL